MTKFMRCHTAVGNRKVGDVFPVTRETSDCYYVEGCGGYSIEPDEDGDSYATWFTLETDEPAPTTLLPDESLGGVLREYREVKRKASVGDRVLIVDAGLSFGHYDDGDVFTITEVIAGDPYFPVKENADNPDGRIFLNDEEYVVLEPTDTLRIDDERFRIVDRKAAVGERVIIVDEGYESCDGFYYRKGNVGRVDRFSGVDIRVDLTENTDYYGNGEWWVSADDYRVLEPLTPAVPTPTPTPTPTPLSALPLVDQYAENITVLTRKIAQLEEGAKALEKRILALETDSAPACVDVASGAAKAADAFAELGRKVIACKTPKAPKSAQDIRDEIVERAKADVLRLKTSYGCGGDFGKGVSFWPDACAKDGYAPIHSVGFEVNAQKRTIVALIHYKSGELCYRGIAKAAPGDVFNSQIGRAIALRRALGLEVPAEYLTCPQPTEIRVGDVVTGGVVYAVRPTHRTVGVSAPQAFVSVDLGYTYIDGGGREVWDHLHYATITDDSRDEDGGISASPSALKGAA